MCIRDRGTTIVMVTHSERDASYADRTIYLLDGKIIDRRCPRLKP